MVEKANGQLDFLMEMSERQISAQEFFGKTLLDSLDRNFGFKNVLILCFDTQNNFLSWTDHTGTKIDSEKHPYRNFAADDEVGHTAFRDAVRDHLTYFNVEPRLYKSTDIIALEDYDSSEYVHFIEKHFSAHYSVTMALGINAYIQIVFFKNAEQGDFTEEEVQQLSDIYISLANSYKNFKKHEHSKIVSDIQDKVISSGENAYIVTDNFLHIINYNKPAGEYIGEIFGKEASEQMDSYETCPWLLLIMGDTGNNDTGSEKVTVNTVRSYTFKIYTYDQHYSHGIIDRYHWVTISGKRAEPADRKQSSSELHLTQAEGKVAELLYEGKTYREIAEQLTVSYHTIKKHVQNIYTKCGVNSRNQLYKLLESEKNQ